ncbi:MAG: EF-hand domain-containing protein [Planctomycetes bacterium]|nr:EF-hand domain-containing protein [Planctomycetota bacterium]
MAQAKSTGALAQYGPVLAPLAGVALALIFIVAAVMTSGIDEGSDKLSGTLQSVRKQLDSTKAEPPKDPIPLADNVSAALEPRQGEDWKAPEGSKKLLALPIEFSIVMDGPKPDEFNQFDENKDGFWDPREWGESPHSIDPGEKGKFENWDRDKDGLISRKEYDDPPTNAAEQFDALDTNDDKRLRAKDGEITQQEEHDWDRSPFDGEIDFSEYERRYEPHEEVEFGPVSGVEAKIDPATMEILVTWQDPGVAKVPKDLTFLIERRAPQTVAKRRSAHSKKVAEYLEKDRQWEARFNKWWNDSTADDTGKTRKQKWPRQAQAQEQYEKETGDSRPVQPEEPSEWEVVNWVTGNEYRDSSFDLDVTYTYAVTMATKSDADRGQRYSKKEGWNIFPDRTAADGHPVIVRNRVEMKWSGAAPPNGTISLVTWHKVTENDVNSWYRVQVTEAFGPDNPNIGGKFKLTDLKSRGVKMFDIAGAEVNAAVLLPADTEIDFSTDFKFVTTTSKGFLLGSSKVGDFELPKASQQAATPDAPASTDNALEVRCLAIKSGAKEGTFELTRWTKVGEQWLRVLWTGSVGSGKEVGGQINLDSPGSGVTVWDAAGNEVKAGDLKKFKDHTVDMKAGTFEGLKDRTVTVGGSDFDLFGTLYKD